MATQQEKALAQDTAREVVKHWRQVLATRQSSYLMNPSAANFDSTYTAMTMYQQWRNRQAEIADWQVTA